MTYGTTKHAVVELLEAAGPAGLDPGQVVAAAAERGIELKPGSVQSSLSRLARDGAVERVPLRYRLRS